METQERPEEIQPTRFAVTRQKMQKFLAVVQSSLSVEQGAMISVATVIRTIMERHYQVTTPPLDKSWHDNRALPKGRHDRFIALTFNNVIDRLSFAFDISSASKVPGTLRLRLRCYIPFYDPHGNRYEAHADTTISIMHHEDTTQREILELIDTVMNKLFDHP